MRFRKFLKTVFFPPTFLIVMLLPFPVAFLVFSLVFSETTAIESIVSYLFAFYLLVVICLRIPDMVEIFKRVKTQNKFFRRLTTDVRFRINLSLYGTLAWNVAFAIL